MSRTWFRFLHPRSRSQSGQRSKSCLSNNSKNTEANLTKLHRKIKHNEKVCCAQELHSYAQGQGHNQVKGQIVPKPRNFSICINWSCCSVERCSLDSSYICHKGSGRFWSVSWSGLWFDFWSDSWTGIRSGSWSGIWSASWSGILSDLWSGIRSEGSF